MIRSIKKYLTSSSTRRGIIAVIIFLLFWEVCSRFHLWFGVQVPWIGKIPAPTSVVQAWIPLLDDAGYWSSWYLSAKRVFSGFLFAMLIGIPFGLILAINRTAYGIMFPTFEVLRPIPPLAWVPASIILCCLVPRKPMVLLMSISPCTSSGKCLLETNSSPEVGLTRCFSSMIDAGVGVASP